MHKFSTILLKRIFTSLITLFLLAVLIFILLRISPGDPVQKFISPKLNPQLVEEIKKTFLLDKSIEEQFLVFLKNIFTGDFGISYNHRLPVTSVIADALKFTIPFASTCFIIQIIAALGLLFNIYKKRGSLLDRVINKVTLILYSFPSIIIALVLILLFALVLNIFPSADLVSINYSNLNPIEKIIDLISHLVLPVITLSLPGTIVFYSYLRHNIDIVYQQNFILFLQASGVEEKTIFKNHVLPNSIRPVISLLGNEFGVLLGGALITETIFSLPGMGRLTVNAILTRDYPLVMGCAIFSGVMILLANLVVDLYKIKTDGRMLSVNL